MDLIELKKTLNNLKNKIDEIFYLAGYDYQCTLDKVEFDRKNPDDIYLYELTRECIEKLGDVKININEMNMPVTEQGKLHINDNGKYELNGFQLSCGMCLEVYMFDTFYGEYAWIRTRIEHNGKKYYFHGNNDLNNMELEDALVRIRF